MLTFLCWYFGIGTVCVPPITVSEMRKQGYVSLHDAVIILVSYIFWPPFLCLYISLYGDSIILWRKKDASKT